MEKGEVSVFRTPTRRELWEAVDRMLAAHSTLLPDSREALILIKPNLNSDLNSLMGNSTDLRLMAAVLTSLVERGYSNIVIADGCNVGVLRRGIDVIGRLRIDRLAARFGARTLDLNRAPGRQITFADGHPALIAEICSDADLCISLPKIKMHSDADMSCAVKNMVGCLVGRASKKALHRDLTGNLVRLYELVKPHLHIVDGLVAMEGNGPGDGTPKRLDAILAGTDALAVDLVVSHLVGYEPQQVRFLARSLEKGYLGSGDVEALADIPRGWLLEKPPPKTRLAEVLSHPVFNRPKDLLRPIHSTRIAMNLLYKAGLIQDIYDERDASVTLRFDAGRCEGSGRCREICPVGLDPTCEGALSGVECIGCLYCYFVCPSEAIHLEGELGFLERQIDRYGAMIRSL
ncbi:hypothetical protein AMJ39_05105 [candidate division TA06 bacterium DG_24]|uniref:4Fe-4S ferredoxin-type domain-containing protein n=3 Tax=Bacteria division TA06 TaxID=1156500 RepID=A0A0S8JSL0_UNCT6|nr:MAG: hypothetical protein AMJ39_05105 [candidate division TA06 bacterium DG_24]KPK71542.1 MAG: hypothetical protein AMJ82_00620 [candidate division TA06 bacterium SM23_40]KPL11646.1 MAG: hypothetical protein AMJ71_00100 [candidate division TA06 bacterium SM1_40]